MAGVAGAPATVDALVRDFRAAKQSYGPPGVRGHAGWAGRAADSGGHIPASQSAIAPSEGPAAGYALSMPVRWGPPRASPASRPLREPGGLRRGSQRGVDVKVILMPPCMCR